MLLFLTIVHFIVALLLIVFVLIQDSKGGGAFGMGGGGGSNQLFSSTGAANFLVKATRVLAVMFAITCLSLAYRTKVTGGSVTDEYVAPPAASTPAKPADTSAPAAPATTPPAQAPATPE